MLATNIDPGDDHLLCYRLQADNARGGIQSKTWDLLCFIHFNQEAFTLIVSLAHQSQVLYFLLVLNNM